MKRLDFLRTGFGIGLSALIPKSFVKEKPKKQEEIQKSLKVNVYLPKNVYQNYYY